MTLLRRLKSLLPTSLHIDSHYPRVHKSTNGVASASPCHGGELRVGVKGVEVTTQAVQEGLRGGVATVEEVNIG